MLEASLPHITAIVLWQVLNAGGRQPLRKEDREVVHGSRSQARAKRGPVARQHGKQKCHAKGSIAPLALRVFGKGCDASLLFYGIEAATWFLCTFPGPVPLAAMSA